MYEISPDRDSLYVHGETTESSGLVLLYNEQTASGSIVTSTSGGDYEAWVPADLRNYLQNHLRIWQRIGLEDSDAVEIDLPALCAITHPDGGLSLPEIGTRLRTSCAPLTEGTGAEPEESGQDAAGDADVSDETEVLEASADR